MRLTLAWVGAAALLLWTGAGLVAWTLTKEQVTLVLAESASARAPAVDPVVLLDEKVGAVAADLRSLVQQLERNFSVLDERGAERAEEARTAVAKEVAAVRAELAALQGAAERTAGLAAEIRALSAAVAALASAPHEAAGEPVLLATPAVAAPEEPAAPAPSGAEGPSPAVAPPAGDLAAIAPAAPPEPAPKRSFLAFQLPSDDFRFAERRRWTIVPSLSRVGFDGTSTLHDFTGATSAVAGELDFDLSRPALAPAGAVRVEAKTLRTGIEGRDEGMFEHLDVERHAEIRFVLQGFEAQEVNAEARKVTGVARGTMTIRGVARDYAMRVVATVDDSRRLLLEGEAPLALSDFGVPVPNKLGLVKMDEEVRVWIALRAKLVPRENPR
ncbi:MAG: YceI family protein [Planctomycetota bacterium]